MSSEHDDSAEQSRQPRSGLEGSATVSVVPSPPQARPAGKQSTAPPPGTLPPASPRARPSDHAPDADAGALPTIPGYEILARLGQGGMGQVFKARSAGTERVIALKLIRADRKDDGVLVRRFQREARAGRRLDHPNIVGFIDAQQVDDVCFLTMEFVEGSDLAQILERADGPLPVAVACEYARQAALGLQHAHERGLIHRDIKPSNLLLTKAGEVIKILDMGLVRLGSCPETGHAESELTHSGVMMGTPAYMAPEQVFDARNVDGRADIYSLGCTLYEMLAGRAPHRHQMKEPMPVHWLRAEVSPVLAAVVQRMMARMPEDRYRAAVDVVKALTPFCHGHHAQSSADEPEEEAGSAPPVDRPPRRWLRWLLLGGALLVIGLGLLGLARARGDNAITSCDAGQEDTKSSPRGP
jgi:serine/threonine protein kinase